MQYPSNYKELVRASVDKAPALTARKRAALRALLHPARVEGQERAQAA
ncbi:hypothetical protein [Micromonospora noduli]|nr:hypothetical protein [Micromonospora noduli]